ncbi:hypothetical protein B0H11DRAFT_1887881 [Mycena galericulata]|nr:hypothetical protein B0H11DRAFT_1887881 [Mycena galericulata]
MPSVPCLVDSEGHFHDSVSPQLADWNRVAAYSWRIRHLDDNYEFLSPIEDSVIQSIIMSLPMGSIMLPNIQIISTKSSSKLFPYLRFFIGSRLSNIDLHLDGPERRFSLLPCLVSKGQDLRHLALSTVASSHEVTEFVSSFICTLNMLQTLQVQSLTMTAFRYLAGLDTLLSLIISDHNFGPFPKDIDSLFPSSSFPALRHLSLIVKSVEVATDFMAAARNAPLQTLSIMAIETTSKNLSAFLSSFSSRHASPSMTSIDIGIEFSSSDSVPNRKFTQSDQHFHPMTSHDLWPLLACTNLCHLQFRAPLRFTLDDDFMAAMALAWPQIQTLVIQGVDPSTLFWSDDREVLSPTTAALISLSRNCPRLRSLALYLDATRFPDHSTQIPRVRQTALLSVDFGNSRIDSPVKVAGLLSSIFPALSSIRAPKYYTEQWREVRDLIPIFAAIRADERELWPSEHRSFAR